MSVISVKLKPRQSSVGFLNFEINRNIPYMVLILLLIFNNILFTIKKSSPVWTGLVAGLPRPPICAYSTHALGVGPQIHSLDFHSISLCMKFTL